MIRKNLWLPVLLATTLATLAGCGSDNGVSYDLVLATDRSSITADATERATITVSVLDNRGNPPELGSVIAVLLQAPGRVSGFPAQQGTALTDSTGLAEFDVECDGNLGEFFVTVAFEGAQGVLPTRITCTEPPDGSWRIQALGVNPDPLLPGEPGRVSFVAVTGSGTAVPENTRMVVAINSGNITFPRGTDTVTERTDASGVFTAAFNYPDDTTSSQICATFENEAFGEQGCTVINPQGAECRGSFSPLAIPADGISVARLNYNVVASSGQPARDVEVSVTVTNAALVDNLDGDNPSQTRLARTDNNGQVGFFVQSTTTGGSPTVEATTAFDDQGVAQALDCQNNSGLVFEPTPECYFQPIVPISFDEFPAETLGILDSPFPTRATVRACFRDLDGDPVSAGQLVTFALRSEAVGYALVPEQAPTDFSGCASTQLRTGTVPDSISVRAELGRPEFQTSCTSETVYAVSGRPVTAGWTTQCNPTNITALQRNDGENVIVECDSPCSTILRDVRGNPVSADLFPISFVSEQGVTSNPVGETSERGRVTFYHEVNGQMPYRFGPPSPGEPCQLTPTLEDAEPCASDNIVSILSYVDGEEWFLDRNQNGFRDEGEPFEDLGEPFLDIGEDGFYDEGVDFFVDTAPRGGSLNGVYDGPNGVWDAETKIWTTSYRLLTGPIDLEVSTIENRGPLSGIGDLTFPPNTRETLRLRLRDSQGNPVSANTIVASSFGGDCIFSNQSVSFDDTSVANDLLNFDPREERTFYGAGGVLLNDGSVNVRDPRVVRFERTLRPRYTPETLTRGTFVDMLIETGDSIFGTCSGTLRFIQGSLLGCSDNYDISTAQPWLVR